MRHSPDQLCWSIRESGRLGTAGMEEFRVTDRNLEAALEMARKYDVAGLRTLACTFLDSLTTRHDGYAQCNW